MRKVIDGKVYATDTATEIASDSSGGSCNDFDYWSETLYCTPRGNYFLHGEGGARSAYAEWYSPRSLGWGEQIIPLGAAEAARQAERLGVCPDVYHRYWPLEEA